MVGEGTGKTINRLLDLGWGRMWIAKSRNIYVRDGEPWGFDNGAYADWTHGRPFDGDAYMKRLDKALAAGTPRLAVIPDKVADPDSLDFSAKWFYTKLPREYPWYLAVQDGMTPAEVDKYRMKVAGIFLGGSSLWKVRNAKTWSDYAKSKGIAFHYGRCGTLRKLDHALRLGVDSLDSCFPMWTVGRLKAFIRKLEVGPEDLPLFQGMDI